HIIDLPAECLACLVQLVEQGAVDLALAGFIGDEVPKVADLALTDTMDAAEPLFDAVGVPWQIVVHHEVRALKVDAFARRIRSDEDLHLGIVPECLLDFETILPADSAMNREDGLAAAE